MIPNARMEACEKAPPANASIRPKHAAFGCLLRLLSLLGSIPGRYNISTNPVNEYQRQGNKNLTSQFFNAPDIFKCLNEFLHGINQNLSIRLKLKKTHRLNASMQVT